MRLHGHQLRFAYEGKPVFADVDMELEPGRVSTLIGPNGVGKSTLIRCLAHLYPPASGVVYLGEEDLAMIAPQERAKNLGYVPQHEKEVFPISVYEAVLLGRRPYIHWRVHDEDMAIVRKIMDTLQISHLAQRDLPTLSGGERQKVAIARALVQEPSVLLLDEPTSSLDLHHQLEMMDLVTELAHAQGLTVLLILHDLNLAVRYSDQVFLLWKNGIYASGSPERVLTPENIHLVYGVRVEVVHTSRGRQFIPYRDDWPREVQSAGR